MIRLERETRIGETTRKTVTYAITSLSRDQADAGRLLAFARARWGIENSCFYVLDTALAEVASRVRSGSAAHALSAIRHAAHSLCRNLGQSIDHVLREHAAKVGLLLSRLRI